MHGQTIKNFLNEFVDTEAGLNFFHVGNDNSEIELVHQLKKTLDNVAIVEDYQQLRHALTPGLAHRGFIPATHPRLLQFIKLASELSNNLRLFLYSNNFSDFNKPSTPQFIRLKYHRNGLFVPGLFLKYLCLNDKLQVALSKTQGLGLFSTVHLKNKDVLFKLFGEIIHLPEDETFDFSGEWNALNEKTLLKRSLRTTYGFINHSRLPNCKVNFEEMRVESIRDIEPGDEILLDYRSEPLPHNYIVEHGSSYL
jgi:hypothetical protein